jgi:predicted esterase
MICAMAASYDSKEIHNTGISIRLPFDLETCTLDNAAWNNWLAFDPLNSIKNNSNSLKSLDLLYIDCGNKDQYGIQYGSRKLIKILQKHGIEHRWEEFEGTHSGIEHRLDISMPMLAKVLYN